MRIILVHSMADLYGASRSLLRLSSRLVIDNHQVRVILKEDGPLVKELKAKNVPVQIMPNLACIDRQTIKSFKSFLMFVKDCFRSAKEFNALINEEKPDIVHTNVALILTAAYVASKRKIPHVWHIRESFKEFGIMWLFFRRFMLKYADVILSVSTPIAEQFDLAKGAQKVRVLYNGFPKEEFEGVTEDRVDRFRDTWGLKNTLNIGVVGRVKLQRKGQEVLIRAAKILNDNERLRFLIIGDVFPGNDEHLRILEKMAKENGVGEKVIFTGGVDDIKAAYKALDISVLTSCLPEPFGGVVIESMALGKPVIGTSIGGTIEQIEENVTGFKVPPGDHIRLAEALNKLINSEDLRVNMGINGRRRFEEKFEFENFYNQLTGVYKRLIQ
ncbi:MAG: glycosyltransferase family 4 protein [Marinoscillum sp.]|uniref:glycosyltransferase family 4 protein n=1 Tax=Marinoscillum sp. TaxID=2024838 RepID=UPI0032F82957